jgi:hypothetical protein
MSEGKSMQINRGEIWSIAWTGFARKPRPALVIQAEEYRLTETDIQEVNARLIKILGIG